MTTACGVTQIKYVEQRFKEKNKFWRRKSRKLDRTVLYHLPFPLVVIIMQRKAELPVAIIAPVQNDAIKLHQKKRKIKKPKLKVYLTAVLNWSNWLFSLEMYFSVSNRYLILHSTTLHVYLSLTLNQVFYQQRWSQYYLVCR